MCRGCSPRFFLHNLFKLLLSIVLLLPMALAANESSGAAVTYTNEELLSQMLIVDASEQTLHNIPVLAVTFSQDLEPAVEFDSFFTVTHNGKLLEGGWILADNPRRLYFKNIQPDSTYRIQVRPGVPARNDELKLQKPGDFEVKTRDIKPAYDFASRGSILPTQLTQGLPVRVVNVPELDLEFLRVKPEQLREVLRSMRLDQSIRSWELNDIKNITRSVYTGRFVTDAPKNARETRMLPVESVAALKEPGLYFAVMRQPGSFTENAYRITHFVVTNIGLHVRMYDKKLEVFARALDSGKPLSGVKLNLHGNKESFQAETGEQGQAGFEVKPKGPLVLIAEREGEFAFLDLRDAALDLSEYPVKGAKDRPVAPFVYAPRDLYRPGEQVDLSVILRGRDGLPTAIKSLNLRMVRPDAKLLLEQNLSAQDAGLGYFNYRFNIPDNGPTGLWRAEIRLTAKDKSPGQVFNFHVEEFMPERMKLELTTDKQVTYNDEKVMVTVQGDYLYGAPAAGNKLKAARVLELDRHPLKSYEDYYFGNPADANLLKREELKELTLDEQGSGALEVPVLVEKSVSPLKMQLIASLSEPAGRVVTRTLDTQHWPAQRLVGIAPSFGGDVIEQNKDAKFSLVRVNQQGELQAAENLSATLVKEERQYFWEYNDQEGWVHRSTSQHYPLVQKKLTWAAGVKGELSFPVGSGRYRVEIEDSETGLKTVYPFYAGWSGRQVQTNRPDQIQLQLDKAAYLGGDTARLMIKSDITAEAVVTVEAGELLWSLPVNLSGSQAELEIPISEDWQRHDLYVTVTAFRAASASEKIASNRSLGIIHLPLDRSERKLQLSINAPDKVMPEKPVEVEISAENLKNTKALVSLAAVDVGVLNITRYPTPDPWAFYFKQHRYAVDIHDAYGKIIESVDAQVMRQRFGGGNAKMAGGPRAKAMTQVVALVKEAVEFDADGKARVELFIPGFDGQLRLMAVALGEKRLGSAEKNMTVASPVVTALSGPRFLAAGDSSFLTLELNNVSEQEQAVKLDITANTLLEFEQVSRELVLTKGQREVIRLPVVAQDKFGVGSVRLKLTGADFTANRSLEMALRPAYPATRKAYAAELKPGEKITIPKELIKGLLPETLQARLTLSNTPVLPIADALQGLLHYPYGCLEQTASGAYPYLFLEAVDTERWGMSPLSMDDRNRNVQEAVLRLAGMQLGSGAFTLWGSYGPAENWLTAYIADFMLDARQQGFNIPERLLKKSLDYLAEQVRSGSRYVSRRGFVDNPAHLQVASRAYGAYVLARQNQTSLGDLRNLLKNDMKKAVTGLPWVHLGLALTLQGDQQQGAEAIKRGLALERTAEAYLGDYGSPIRDKAMMLYQLLLNKHKIPELGQQVKSLADLLQQRQYLSTQEQVFVYLLGRELEKLAEDEWSAELVLQGESSQLDTSGTYVRILSAVDFTDLQVHSRHEESLYGNLVIQAYSEQAPAKRDEPISIQRQWFNMAGQEVVQSAIKPGDLLLTRLRLESKEAINDALVIDMLPSGFEIENTHLIENKSLQGLSLADMNTSVLDTIASINKQTEQFLEDRYMAALTLRSGVPYHLFYLVRVVSPGNSTVPPPYVEDMYRPEIFGIGEATADLILR